MPLYEYECQTCKHKFNEMRKYENRHDIEQDPCPECGELDVLYRISCPNIAYSNPGSMKTTDSFNDRLKDIKKVMPEKYKGKLNDIIR